MAGIGSRHRLSGVANGGSDEIEHTNDAIRLAAHVRTPDNHSGDDSLPEASVMTNASDPLSLARRNALE